MKLVVLACTVALLGAGEAPAPSPGDIAFRHGDFDAAYAAYADAVAANPSDANAALGLGTIELYRNDLATAQRDLGKAAALDLANPRAQARLKAVAGREPNGTDFQIEMPGDRIDIPFLATDPLPVLHAKINGADATLFLDTGAPSLVLTPEAAQRLKVPTKSGGQGVFAGGLTGSVSTGRVDSVAFDGLTVRGIDADVLPAPVELGGRKLDGAIGTVFLYHFLSTIDYVHGRLTLRPRSASPAFEAEAKSGGAAVVPMWLVGDHFIFARANVNQAPAALFNIDTGRFEGIHLHGGRRRCAHASVHGLERLARLVLANERARALFPRRRPIQDLSVRRRGHALARVLPSRRTHLRLRGDAVGRSSRVVTNASTP